MGWYDGMDNEFARRLRAFIEASGGRIGVGSGYRSIEEQTALWEASDKSGWLVAPPGKSNHNHGVAADLSYLTGDAVEWAHNNAARFGLTFPMYWEDWHIEPIGVRDGTYKSSVSVDGESPGQPDAYTIPPDGHSQVVDPNKRFDLGYQLENLNSLLMRQHDPSMLDPFGGGGGSLDAPSSDTLATPAREVM
jgi:hypothetical protein